MTGTNVSAATCAGILFRATCGKEIGSVSSRAAMCARHIGVPGSAGIYPPSDLSWATYRIMASLSFPGCTWTGHRPGTVRTFLLSADRTWLTNPHVEVRSRMCITPDVQLYRMFCSLQISSSRYTLVYAHKHTLCL